MELEEQLDILVFRFSYPQGARCWTAYRLGYAVRPPGHAGRLHTRPIIFLDALDECEDMSKLLSQLVKLSH